MATVFDHLLNGTIGLAHAWSLPNTKGEGRERWIGSRDENRLEAFVKKRDEPGFGTFFCTSTIAEGHPRKKEFALETPWAHADTDFKNLDLPPEAIEDILLRLPCVPSRMHHTGNGIHSFWRFKRPLILARDMERLEIVLRQIANYLGSDPMVAHCVALMRVPGSHNSKRGEWREVRVIREGRETYSLEDLEQWMSSARDPVMVARGRALNPFERIAHEQGFKPPVDVEARLANMVIGGIGEDGVHATQLSCTASLMASGVDEDDVVTMVLDATKELPGTDGWDWVEEERNLHGMCRDWVKKFPRQATLHDIRPAVEAANLQSETKTNEAPADVVHLAEARKERDEEREERKERVRDKLKKKNEHIYLGEGILEELALANERIMYNQNQFWICRAGVWESMGLDEEKTWINVRVEKGCRAAKMVSTTKLVNETRSWLQRHPDLHIEHVPWDAHGKIATRSGLVDWQTGEVEPLHSDDYVSRVIECRYIPEADCPIWKKMLTEDYGFDEPTVAFLQECAGAALLVEKPRGLRRALVLLGPSNTGKSNILKVLAGLISTTVNPTPLLMLENSHGLMPFLKPHPWVLHEAFEQSRWEMSATAKALLSGDQISVNIKNGPLLPLTFKQPIFWGSNVPPQFREASRAMENRLAIVQMHRAFNPMRVIGTAARAADEGYGNPAELVLNQEMAGLLNWAIAGLKRAMARAHYIFTDEMKANLYRMRMDANMATAFISDCCEYDPDSYVTTSDFYGAFKVWWTDHRGGQVPSVDALSRSMKSLSDPRIVVGERINQKRIYAGVRLNQEGLDCWNAYSSSTMAERSGQRIASTANEVNQIITPEAAQKPIFVAMRNAHATWQPDAED